MFEFSNLILRTRKVLVSRMVFIDLLIVSDMCFCIIFSDIVMLGLLEMVNFDFMLGIFMVNFDKVSSSMSCDCWRSTRDINFCKDKFMMLNLVIMRCMFFIFFLESVFGGVVIFFLSVNMMCFIFICNVRIVKIRRSVDIFLLLLCILFLSVMCESVELCFCVMMVLCVCCVLVNVLFLFCIFIVRRSIRVSRFFRGIFGMGYVFKIFMMFEFFMLSLLICV